MPPKKRAREEDSEIIDVDDVQAKKPKPGGQLKQRTLTTAVTTTSADAGPLHLAETISDPTWKAIASTTLARIPSIETTLAAETAAGKQIFPPLKMVFSAFNETPWDKVKVVVIGQDPYHDDGQAHGMCFSVLAGVKPPPSLKNMYKELTTDIPGFKEPNHGYLLSWAHQGVLLLNATLTVEAHKPNSHAKIGWLQFTDAVIAELSEKHSALVFLLWGGFAQKKGKKIDRQKHKVIECAHPSPLSVTQWMGCKTFSKCNEALVALGKTPIDWSLPAEAK